MLMELREGSCTSAVRPNKQNILETYLIKKLRIKLGHLPYHERSF